MIDWAVVLATLAGPVLAVQAQKWIERARENTNKKQWVFQSLMSSRGFRVSAQFTNGLNAIDLAFNGGNPKKRTPSEVKVIDAWRAYHRELTDGINEQSTEGEITAWNKRLDTLSATLLSAMATDLGYSFDLDTLKTGWYYARGLATHENEVAEIRNALVRMTRGHLAVPVMNVQKGEDGQLRPVVFPGQQ